MDEEIKKILENPKAFFDGLGIAYRQGFKDGMNFEIKCPSNSDGELTDKEFDSIGISEIIDKETEKLKKVVLDQLKK